MENKEVICMKKRLLALLLCLTMLAGNLAIAESVEVEQPEATATEETVIAVEVEEPAAEVIEEKAEEPVAEAEPEVAEQVEETKPETEEVEEVVEETVPETEEVVEETETETEEPAKETAPEVTEETTPEVAVETEDAVDETEPAEEAEPVEEETAEEEATEADEVETDDAYKLSILDQSVIGITVGYQDGGAFKQVANYVDGYLRTDWDANRKVAYYVDTDGVSHDLQIYVSILNMEGEIANTESDLENITYRITNNIGTVFELPLKDFERDTNVEYVFYAKVIDFPQSLYVSGYQDLTAILYDNVTGIINDSTPKASITGSSTPEVCAISVTAEIVGNAIKVNADFAPGKGIEVYVQLRPYDSQIADHEKILTEPDTVTFEDIDIGTHEVFVFMDLNSDLIYSWDNYLTIGDWTKAPSSIALTQTAANALTVDISGKAPAYYVEYQYTLDGQEYEGNVSAKAKSGDASVTLNKLPTSTEVIVRVYSMDAKGGKCSQYAEARRTMADWSWTKKPSLKVYQDMTQEDTLVLEFTNDELPAFRAAANIGYEVYVDNNNTVLYMSTDAKLTPVGSSEISGIAEEDVWLVYVPYSYAKAKETITVTPVLLDDNYKVAVRGSAASVKYNRANFLDEAWAAAPTVEQQPVDCNTVSFKVTLNAKATDAVIYIDGALYSDGKNVLTLNTLPETGPVTAVQDTDNKNVWTVTLTYGAAPLAYGKHTIAFAAVDPSKTEDLPYATPSKAVTVSISATPAWVTKKITLKAAQLDDTTLQLTFTNLGEAGNKVGLKNYVLYVDDEKAADISFAELTKDKKGNLVYEYQFGDLSYARHSFMVTATGTYAGDTVDTVEGKEGKATITLTELWKTAPTVTFKANNATDLATTMTVTGKGNPDGFNIYVYDEADKEWHCIEGYKGAEETGYDAPHGIKLERTDFGNAVAQYTVTATEAFSKAVQFKAVAWNTNSVIVKGNESKVAKLTMAPAWMSKSIKVTVTQTLENEIRVDWKTLTGIDNYYVVLKDSTGAQVGDGKTIPTGGEYAPTTTFTTDYGSYIVEVTPVKGELKGKTSTAKVTTKALWSKTPVVKLVSNNGVRIECTVTYYGKPASLDIVLTGPNGYSQTKTVSSADLHDYGTQGSTGTYSFYVYDQADGSDIRTYRPGNYILTATVSDGAETSKPVSKSLKFTVNDSFLSTPAQIKSFKQTNEKEAILILKKALGTADLSRWCTLSLVDVDGETYWTSNKLSAGWTTMTLDLTQVKSIASDTLHIITYLRDGEVYQGTDVSIPLKKYLSVNYVNYALTVPAFTVVQSGPTSIRVTMTKGTAAEYAIKVTSGTTDLFSHTVKQNDFTDVDVSVVDTSKPLSVVVMPYVNDTIEDAYVSKAQTITVKDTWNAVSGVAAAQVKKAKQLKVTWNYDGAADGVYINIYGTNGQLVKREAVPASELTLAAGKKANTATYIVSTELDDGNQLVGKYNVEVTPYLVDDNDSVTTIGDSRLSKTVSIASVK